MTPPETVYLEMVQLGIVSDLSVHLPEGHVGTAGMSIAKALTARTAVARIVEIPILICSRFAVGKLCRYDAQELVKL